MYAISRLKTKRNFWYWQVAFRRRGKGYCKTFYDVRRGGEHQALADAIQWRDEQLRRLGALSKREFCQVIRTNNSSGVPGVQFIRPKGAPQGSWQARLKLPGGRERTKTFAVLKYGEREAYQRAVAAREKLLEEIENGPYLKSEEAKAISYLTENAESVNPAPALQRS